MASMDETTTSIVSDTFTCMEASQVMSMTSESSMAERNSAPSVFTINDRTCHMLPCSIDYQGMASSHVYFRPVEADGVVHSTFRGRGLLALAPLVTTNADKSNDCEKSGVLSAALLSVQNQHLQIKADIDHILEWHHEYNPETLFLETNTSRVEVAKEWSEVAFALHESIPVQDVTMPSCS